MLGISIYFFTTCITLLVHLLCFKEIVDKKIENKLFLFLLITISSIIISAINTLSINIINPILQILIILILYLIAFKTLIKETLVYGISIWLIGIILDIVISLIINAIGLSSLPFELIYIRAIASIILLGILYSIFKTKKVLTLSREMYKKMDKNEFIYLKLILVILTLISLSYIIFSKMLNRNFAFFAIILSILIIVLIFLYLKNEYNVLTLKETNKLLIKNNELNIGIINEYKILKHNIIHKLTGVKSVSNKKTIKLIDDIIIEYNENFTSTSTINKMPVGINGLVYEKIFAFNNKKIKLGIDNKIETNIFDNLTPRSYNLLCEALGILLDNALEATSKSKDKVIMIDMYETSNSYNVKIINTFSNELDLEYLGTIDYTTKKIGHGVGLFSLFGKKKLKIKTSIINNLFQNEICIDKKQK